MDTRTPHAPLTDYAPEIPGPAIAHCGAWHPLTALPWWCPQCGALLGLCLEEE